MNTPRKAEVVDNPVKQIGPAAGTQPFPLDGTKLSWQAGTNGGPGQTNAGPASKMAWDGMGSDNNPNTKMAWEQ